MVSLSNLAAVAFEATRDGANLVKENLPGGRLHMARLFRRLQTMAAAIGVTAALSIVSSAQTMGSPERYTANAINMNRGAAGNIQITVNRWSIDKDRDRLMTA